MWNKLATTYCSNIRIRLKTLLLQLFSNHFICAALGDSLRAINCMIRHLKSRLTIWSKHLGITAFHRSIAYGCWRDLLDYDDLRRMRMNKLKLLLEELLAKSAIDLPHRSSSQLTVFFVRSLEKDDDSEGLSLQLFYGPRNTKYVYTCALDEMSKTSSKNKHLDKRDQSTPEAIIVLLGLEVAS